ncbi:MAG: 30S ribosomal protein S8 [Candidatus Pacearchaeota archaeon]
MVVREWLGNALNSFMNCLRRGEYEIKVAPVNNLMLSVFELMKKHNYLEEIKISNEKNYRVAEIKLGKRLHECKAIKPRLVFRHKFLDKYIQRYLPSRSMGILIVSTNKGIMTHNEAIEKGLGGCLIAYCF